MITVRTTIQASVEKVWDCFTNPAHITNWYFAAPEWHCPRATNDVKVEGKFSFTMSAKGGSNDFDFEGIYTAVELYKQINYELADGRKVIISFTQNENDVLIIESFDPEDENTYELQQGGWQAILNNFKSYVEGLYNRS